MDLSTMSAEERSEAICKVFQWIRSNGGKLPLKAYRERIKTFPTVHHECIEFGISPDGKRYVLLDRRPDDDPDYSGMFGTQGFTVMTGMTLDHMLEKHCAEESGIPLSGGRFVFCGLGVSPLTRRDHAYVPIFARLVQRHASATEEPGQYERHWIRIDELDSYSIVPSNRAYLNLAIDVVFNSARPDYAEFLGSV